MNRLAIHGGPSVITEEEARFSWPKITEQTEQVVMKQLHESISIYDNSGIFHEFEKTFSDYHGREYGLLSNSGTSAILAMFEAIGIRASDKVIAPVYTFHATISPLMYLGGEPVFCDTDNEGNIALDEVIARHEDGVKAVIVTHMWGRPVKNIVDIAEYCQQKGLYLLEDCSHAHGAHINGKPVGSFGDAAVWSLQGQKIISGGEGGILLTDNRNLYERALLHGHYNKRPLKEIRDDNPLKEYYLTGFGLKLRAHPLAVAIAKEQFSKLDEFIRIKQRHAEKLAAALETIPFLELPAVSSEIQNSWYVFPFKYINEETFGVSRERFVEALQAEGLVEVDIPGSTGLVHELPLFLDPGSALGRLYHNRFTPQTGFSTAQHFYESLIKIPVWADVDNEFVVDAYIQGISKVANHLLESQTL